MKQERVLAGVAFGAIVLMAAACVRPPALWFERGQDHSVIRLSAAPYNVLRLSGGSAQVFLNARTDDSLIVRVMLRSTDRRRLEDVCLRTAGLDTAFENGRLSLAIRQPNRDRCGEEWRVEAPPRLLAQLDFDHGDIEVHGLSGGLDIHLGGTGGVKGEIVRGPVSIDVGVANVDLSVRDADYSEIKLESKVGKASLTVNGFAQSPTKRLGAATKLHIRGPGGDLMSILTKVGSIRASIGQVAK